MVGFGGELTPSELADLSSADRANLLNFAFGRSGRGMALNLVRWTNDGYPEGGLRPGADPFWGANDNSDPNVIDWSTFKWGGRKGPLPEDAVGQSEAATISAVSRLGVNGDYFGTIQGPKWNGFWQASDGPAPPDTKSSFSPDENVENTLALLLHYRKYGTVFPMVSPFSEPSGGGINWVISADQAVQVVTRLGQRLEANGFTNVKMSIPGCTNIADSIRYAQAILGDPAARRYVGAIEYHAYGAAGGLGGVDPTSQQPDYVAARRQLSALAASYGVPVRMTEYADSADLLGRANSVFNELEFANSQTYMALLVFASASSRHSQGQGDSAGMVFYTPGSNGGVTGIAPTSATGVAVGQYSRHVAPGAVRLGVTSSDPGLRVQAFRQDAAGNLSLIVINNQASPQTVAVRLTGPLAVTGPIKGEYTSQGGASYWQPVPAFSPQGPQTLEFGVPGMSITSLDLPAPGTGVGGPARTAGGAPRTVTGGTAGPSPSSSPGLSPASDPGLTTPGPIAAGTRNAVGAARRRSRSIRPYWWVLGGMVTLAAIGGGVWLSRRGKPAPAP